MKNLILLLLTGCSSLAQINQMQTVNSIAELQSLNAKTAKTNTFAVYGLVFGDGKGGIWTWKAGDTAATNGVESGGPIASANPLSGTGRWYRVSQPGGGTNYFSTTIVTNLTVISNTIINNLTVNTNITVSGTNVGTINPTIDYLPVKTGTNSFGDSPVYRIATNVVGVDEIWAYSVSATNLQPGGVVISLPPSGVLTNVPFGVGVLSQDASSNITWSSVSGSKWTNEGGVLHPTDMTLPVRGLKFSAYGGEAASPAYNFTNSLNSGYYHSSGIHHWSEAGNEFMRLYYNISPYSSAGTLNLGRGAIAFGSGVTALDTYMGRDAADTVAMQRGDNPQTFKVYGSTNATGFARASFSHSGPGGAITFDNQATGSEAPAVGFLFTNAPVVLHGYTKAQKALLTPVNGMVLYQTDNTPGLRAYVNGSWVILSTAADP